MNFNLSYDISFQMKIDTDYICHFLFSCYRLLLTTKAGLFERFNPRFGCSFEYMSIIARHYLKIDKSKNIKNRKAMDFRFYTM